MELVEGVHDLTLTYEERDMTIHPAAIETDHGLLLADAGLPGSVDRLDAVLADAGHSIDDVAIVLLTHQDGDHAGGLAGIRRRTDALSVAHEADAPAIAGDETPLKSSGSRYPAAPVDLELVGGETFTTAAGPMRVVHTPGHTPGHVSLYFPDERLLVAADALTAPEGELSGPNERFTPEMDEAADSVARLAEFDVERVLCYHGGPIEAGSDEIRAIAESMRS